MLYGLFVGYETFINVGLSRSGSTPRAGSYFLATTKVPKLAWVLTKLRQMRAR